jgi:ubiquinone/menaquinone biosynthesis C-methylase UbiE
MDSQSVRENAFSQILGEDYKLLKFSYPHHDQFQKAVAQQVSQHFALSEADEIKVLEAGAGSGVTTSFLLAADPRVRVLAVDNAKAMLDQAAALLSNDRRRVELVEAYILEYAQQQADQSIDAFVAVWTLHNLTPEYRSELFTEIRRILKPGGIFVSGDKYTVNDDTQHQQLLEMQLNRFREYPTQNKAIAQAWVDHNLEDEAIKIGEDEQYGILERLGFVGVETVYRQDMEAIIKGVVD